MYGLMEKDIRLKNKRHITFLIFTYLYNGNSGLFCEDELEVTLVKHSIAIFERMKTSLKYGKNINRR